MKTQKERKEEIELDEFGKKRTIKVIRTYDAMSDNWIFWDSKEQKKYDIHTHKRIDF